jgi:hypothetical protein
METADERRGQGSGAGDEDVTASINDAAQLARREWCTERQVNLTLSLAFLALNSSRQRSKDVSINIERLCDPDPELGPRSFESSVSFRAKHLPTRAQQIKIAELPPRQYAALSWTTARECVSVAVCNVPGAAALQCGAQAARSSGCAICANAPLCRHAARATPWDDL